jgi:archaellum component FlaG (FlaF/FlaG flagellin family)
MYASFRNQVIRRLDLVRKELSVVAGKWKTKGFSDGVGTEAMFEMPRTIDCSSDDNFAVISDYNNKCIRNMSLTTMEVKTITCGGLITSPSDIAVFLDGGVYKVYIADSMSHTILLWDGQAVQRVAGVTDEAGFEVCVCVYVHMHAMNRL